MTRLICIIVFTSFALCSCDLTKSDKDKERINSVCDTFMQNFRDENIADAMQLLKQNSVMAHSTLDTLEMAINDQIKKMILPNYGKILSYEFITERKIKNFVAKRFYILKLKKYYLKFDFTLYNNGAGWVITNFNYNEDLIEILY